MLPNFWLLLTKLLYTNFIYATLACLLVQKAKPGFYLFWLKYKSSPASLDLPPLPVFHLLVCFSAKKQYDLSPSISPLFWTKCIKMITPDLCLLLILERCFGLEPLISKSLPNEKRGKNVEIKVKKEGLQFLILDEMSPQ